MYIILNYILYSSSQSTSLSAQSHLFNQGRPHVISCCCFLVASADYLDIVKDPISSGDYRKEEDPVLFVSSKTSRGPLDENWREEYTTANKAGTLYMRLAAPSVHVVFY